MSRKIKLFALPITVIVLFLTLLTGTSALKYDGAGNATETLGNNDRVEVEGDYVFLYTSGNANKRDVIRGSIGGDLLALGGNIGVEEAEVGGNIRIASLSLDIDRTVARNATLASYTINIGEDTEFAAVYCIGQEVFFYGNCEYLNIQGGTVYIYGNVTNGAEIYADTVYFAESCNIEKAAVEGMYTPYYLDKDNNRIKYTDNQTLAGKISYTKTPGILQRNFSDLRYKLPAAILLGLLMSLLLGKALDESGERFKYSSGKTIGYGLLGAFLVPIVIIMLFMIAYTTVVGMITGFAYLMIALAAKAFTSASFARLALPNLNKYLSSLIGISLVTVLSVFSGLNLMITLFSLVFTFGYLILRLTERKKEQPPAETDSYQL